MIINCNPDDDILKMITDPMQGTFDDNAEIIYHYTSPEGVIGILEKDDVKLHFTKYTGMNDTTEGIVIYEKFRSICDKLEQEKYIDFNLKEKLIGLIDTISPRNQLRIKKEIDGEEKEFSLDDLYICCFSVENDALPMWNYYTKNGEHQGYALGFKSLRVLSRKKDSTVAVNLLCYRVDYYEEKLENYVRAYISSIRNNPDMDIMNHGFDLIKRYLILGSIMHKSSCFKHENEIRMVLLAGEEDKQELKFKTKNGILIPYLELFFDKSSLKKITIGPLIEKDLASNNLVEFLQHKGYQDIEIQHSKVPIRY